MTVTVNQTEVAALVGVTPRRIRTLESEGWFSRDAHGKYDVDEVKQVFAGMNPSNRLAGNLNNGKGYTIGANSNAAAVADDECLVISGGKHVPSYKAANSMFRCLIGWPRGALLTPTTEIPPRPL
ncbi:hypothetical protein TRL7639_00478 [Falsiruegeria litorea R37]|uniref:Uncharacterized protein n=1 Tax=Falsiruegeria litorea R37 TaxID=1200284 RepID=A0A1Y5RLR6_9RHOB|nr:hypothetical protein [Falsiruegeria litorea]SLN20051.1 hypothetical protein TRL7639_00478 [Falsiruegeria litorea R37]